VVVTTGAIRCVYFHSKCHQQQTNTQFLQAGCPSYHPTNSVKALKEKLLYQSVSCDYSIERVGGCSSPSPRPWARRWRTTNKCDVWPVRRQTYGYLPSQTSTI